MRANKLCTTLAALFAISPVAAHAQPGFGRVANTPYNGGITVINNTTKPNTPSTKVKIGSSAVATAAAGGTTTPQVPPPSFPGRVLSVNMMSPFKMAWQAERRAVTDTALKYLDERDIGHGYRTSRNRLTLAADGPLFVGTDAMGFTLRFHLDNNVLSTYLRTPTKLSGDLDPGFIINFDLDIIMDVDVQNNQLVARPAQIRPTVHDPVGKNITGALAVAIANLVKTLSGPDFIGALQSQVNGKAFPLGRGLDDAIGRINPFLRQAAPGGVIVVSYNADNGNVILTLRNPAPAPVIH